MLKMMTRALIINLYMFGSFIKNLAVCNLNTLVVIIDENEIKKKKKQSCLQVTNVTKLSQWW